MSEQIDYDDLWVVCISPAGLPCRAKQDEIAGGLGYIVIFADGSRLWETLESFGAYRVLNRRELVLVRQTSAELEIMEISDSE